MYLKPTVLLLMLNLTSGSILNNVFSRKSDVCYTNKPGASYGEATLFQEEWVHGKTGACGFNKPNTDHADGYFAAVGAGDWDNGFGCGTCAELSYKGRKVIVNIVDRCWGCSKGWFDMGGPAWRDLTNGAPPGHIHDVESRWVECPSNLTGGGNLFIYVKPGSHPWDARFQPVGNIAPVTGMSIDLGSGWKEMQKCENFFFCKPAGPTIPKNYRLRVTSYNTNIDIDMSSIPEGDYIDMKKNNGGAACGGDTSPTSPSVKPTTTRRPRPIVTSAKPTAPPFVAPSGPGNCSKDGLFPDPEDCKGMVKCAQGNTYKLKCSPGLVFDLVTYNCNWPHNTDCGSRPL